MQDSEFRSKKLTILAFSLLSQALAFGVAKAYGENTGNPPTLTDSAIAEAQRCVYRRGRSRFGRSGLVALPEVIFVEPLGTERGLLQIEVFVRDTFGKMFSKRDLQLENPSIHVYGDTAWSEITWTFHATLRDGEKPLVTNGRETQILRKDDGAWHIIAIHYSGLPVNGKAQRF